MTRRPCASPSRRRPWSARPSCVPRPGRGRPGRSPPSISDPTVSPSFTRRRRRPAGNVTVVWTSRQGTVRNRPVGLLGRRRLVEGSSDWSPGWGLAAPSWLVRDCRGAADGTADSGLERGATRGPGPSRPPARPAGLVINHAARDRANFDRSPAVAVGPSRHATVIWRRRRPAGGPARGPHATRRRVAVSRRTLDTGAGIDDLAAAPTVPSARSGRPLEGVQAQGTGRARPADCGPRAITVSPR